MWCSVTLPHTIVIPITATETGILPSEFPQNNLQLPVYASMSMHVQRCCKKYTAHPSLGGSP